MLQEPCTLYQEEANHLGKVIAFQRKQWHTYQPTPAPEFAMSVHKCHHLESSQPSSLKQNFANTSQISNIRTLIRIRYNLGGFRIDQGWGNKSMQARMHNIYKSAHRCCLHQAADAIHSLWHHCSYESHPLILLHWTPATTPQLCAKKT